MSTKSLTLTRPDDWHVHLRDGAVLAGTVPHCARYFRRAIIMPNLSPPVTTSGRARQYRESILQQLPQGTPFNPLMTLYLTDSLATSEIRQAHKDATIVAVKYYPAGATTNSENGVTDIERVYPVLETLAELGLPLLVHGEVTDGEIDIFDREAVFIERILQPLIYRCPGLKIVLEHITTREAVQFVMAQDGHIAATITVHHLLCNRNDLLVGGVRPHFYCLPILKRNVHQKALIGAATSGNKKFFLGTDSAPHGIESKESSCGCAGIYTAHAAIELYAEAFDAAGALDKLEAFASFNGPDFYGLPRNRDKIELERKAWKIPATYRLGDKTVVPMRAGEEIQWRVKENI